MLDGKKSETTKTVNMMVFARVFLICVVFCVSVLGLGSAEKSPCWSPLGSDRCKGVLRTKTLGRRVMAGRPSTRGEIPWQVSFLVNFLEDCRLRTKKFHYANSRGVFKK
uniref:Uncharacterized protein n=1 Tax=Cacopsylla melanoneura TaxID=428564 RepID=A0A8D9A919_9HEMI